MNIGLIGARNLLPQWLQKALRITAVMADSDLMKSNELKLLFDRLQEAKRQAQDLQQEVANIKTDIERVEGHKCFDSIPKFRFDSDDFTCFVSLNKSDSDDSFTLGTPPPPKKPKIEFPEENGYVVVYTDGACVNNGSHHAQAGIGVWFGDNHPLNVSKPVIGKATNNAAEIQACICAVEIALEHSICKLNVRSDSQFLIKAMTAWIHGWKKNGWRLTGSKNLVKNKTDFQKLDDLCQGIDVKWEYVAGHKGIRGNEEADRLAKQGAKQYQITD